MSNYKIKVSNEAESREAQELFFALGAKCAEVENNHESIQMWGDATITSHSKHDEVDYCFKELTLPQLRDLVVLHRNDVKDANFKLFISSSQGYLSLYKASDDVFYVYAEKSKCWDKSRSVSIETKDLEPIQASKENEQGLISGADALRALAEGKEVDACVTLRPSTEEWHWFDAKNLTVKEIESEETMGLPDGSDIRKIVFRLKPRTIKLELEIPAPFEPKEGETYWCFSTQTVLGYGHNVYESERADRRFMNMGAWRTEEEIKQVVAALRRGIKG